MGTIFKSIYQPSVGYSSIYTLAIYGADTVGYYTVSTQAKQNVNVYWHWVFGVIIGMHVFDRNNKFEV
jgi:hypothetical protein